MNDYVFIIPCLNPGKVLISLVSELVELTDGLIIIIDDGSNECSRQYFKNIVENKKYKDRVILLKHYINMGKGAALKTAFKYIIENLPEINFVVTLDCDGQHSVQDCKKILQTIKENPESLVLGYRNFSKNIPLRNYIGNKISKIVYSLILGVSLKDTQTGLRALNRKMIEECLKIPYNGYEFETEQLINLIKHKKFNVVQIPITTIYVDKQPSHFNPVLDSFKIYFVLFRYFFSSLATATVDFIFFVCSLNLIHNVFYSNLISRFFALIFQFYILKQIVFKVRSYLLIRFFPLFRMYFLWV